ncbi:MAG: hypothetical protein AAB262_05835, partial [Elusimicrobiota bacterium]
YNKIWHTSKWFVFWEYETISKHLYGDDAPLVLAAFAALALFAYVLKSCLDSSRECWTPRELAKRAAASALLAVSFAGLTRLGMTETLYPLTYTNFNAIGLNWVIGFALLFFACVGWRRTQEPGLKVLGCLILVVILILLHTPVVCNVLFHVPLLRNFHNTAPAYRWDFQLMLAILGAAGLQTCRERSRGPWPLKWREALNMFSIICVFVLGCLLPLTFEAALARRMDTSVFSADGRQSLLGGIMGPERQTTFRRSWTVTGWVPAWPPPTSIIAGLSQNQQSVSGVQATLDAPLRNRVYFQATLPLPRDAQAQVLAQVKQGNSARTLVGTQITARSWPAGPVTRRIFIACVLCLPLVFLLGPWSVTLAQILLLISTVQFRSAAISPGDIPYRLPAIEKIKSDGGLSRLYSLQYTFLQADYANVYELADLRTGGDNLDVLTMIYFGSLTGSLLGGGQSSAAFDLGLRLLGLANVKYMLDFPGANFANPSLVPDYRGPDMAVFLNTHFMPRAIFFDEYRYVPMGDWRDWGARGRFLAPLAEDLIQKRIDPAATLVLNDEPSPAFMSRGRSRGRRPAVVIDRYAPDRVSLSVETDRPGFVFLSDNHFPGWEATVNGVATRILRSWLTFRAVEVPAGRSTIEFVYRPLGLRIAVCLAALASLGWLLCYRKYAPGLLSETGVDDLAASCAALARPLVLAMVAAVLVFWTLWAGFIYAGGIQRMRWGEGFATNLAACGVLLLLATLWGLDLKTSRRA